MTRKPPNQPNHIPLYPVPPFPPIPKRQTRSSSLLSDGFPPIRIIKTPSRSRSPGPSSVRQAAQSHLRPYKTGLGDKNIVNSIASDFFRPARNVKVRLKFHSGFMLAGVLL